MPTHQCSRTLAGVQLPNPGHQQLGAPCMHRLTPCDVSSCVPCKHTASILPGSLIGGTCSTTCGCMTL
jgi:hypothetical protein